MGVFPGSQPPPDEHCPANGSSRQGGGNAQRKGRGRCDNQIHPGLRLFSPVDELGHRDLMSPGRGFCDPLHNSPAICPGGALPDDLAVDPENQLAADQGPIPFKAVRFQAEGLVCRDLVRQPDEGICLPLPLGRTALSFPPLPGADDPSGA